MLIDTGSSVNIIGKNSFEKVAGKNKNRLQPSKTKLYPYVSEPLVTKGYFICKFTKRQITLQSKNVMFLIRLK